MTMKKATTVLVFVASVAAGAILGRPARAYPDAMCFKTADCNNKCEVCVKAGQFDPSGKCKTIAGCY